jgi:hypothetical protein
MQPNAEGEPEEAVLRLSGILTDYNLPPILGHPG